MKASEGGEFLLLLLFALFCLYLRGLYGALNGRGGGISGIVGCLEESVDESHSEFLRNSVKAAEGGEFLPLLLLDLLDLPCDGCFRRCFCCCNFAICCWSRSCFSSRSARSSVSLSLSSSCFFVASA